MHNADRYETMSIQNGEKSLSKKNIFVYANTNFLFYNYMCSFL